MSTKPRYPASVGLEVARELCAELKPVTERLIVAGSLRRRKPDIGDLELLYIERFETRPDPADLFAHARSFCVTDETIARLERDGVLERRTSVRGSEMFGPLNKYMRHVRTGLPVDLFATTAECWFNYLVCRTGPADSNERIARAAQAKGWTWNPYGTGFSQGTRHAQGGDEAHVVTSEREVFDFVGLPFAEPWERR